MKSTQTTHALTVYYDGLCHLCSREMQYYYKQPGSGQIRFCDIMDPEFDAAAEGLDPKHVHQVMHVKTQQGELKTGPDAFIAIWEVLPRFASCAKLAKKPLPHLVMSIGYSLFATVRPYLPQRAERCHLGRIRAAQKRPTASAQPASSTQKTTKKQKSKAASGSSS